MIYIKNSYVFNITLNLWVYIMFCSIHPNNTMINKAPTQNHGEILVCFSSELQRERTTFCVHLNNLLSYHLPIQQGK